MGFARAVFHANHKPAMQGNDEALDDFGTIPIPI
jgi:hypothetical protein